mgnify:CR=1 FL=1
MFVPDWTLAEAATGLESPHVGKMSDPLLARVFLEKNHLTSSAWYDALARLLNHLGGEQFHPLLVSVLKQVAPFDHAVIIAYPDGKRPLHIYNDLPEKQIRSTLETYFNGAYLLDPFYSAAQNHIAEGYYRLRNLAPDEFYSSEYYRSYYRGTKLEDELGILVEVGTGLRVIVSLGVLGGETPVRNTELSELALVLPLLNAICKRHWREIGMLDGVDYVQAVDNTRLSDTLDLAFRNFGRDYLSERECEIVRMVLKGYSSQSIGELLHISTDTVKAHRKNVHRKLEISSHGELFSLFLDAICLVDLGSSDDPLNVYYAAKPS